MEQPFYIGQEVVALKSASNNFGVELTKGEVYIVKDMIQCKCGNWHIDVGISLSYLGMTACECGKIIVPQTRICHVSARLLAPVSRLRISDELTIAADLLQPQVEERADVHELVNN